MLSARDPEPDPILIGNAVLAIKSFVAPRQSKRERILRWFTRPLLRMLLRRRQPRAIQLADRASPVPIATVVQWRGLAERAATLPERARILILKLDHIGDLILSIGALEHIRGRFPNAAITLVCGSWNRALAERTGLFDELITFDFYSRRKGEWTGAREDDFDRFKALGLGEFDIAIDLRHDPDTRQLLPLVRAKFRAGFCAPFDKGGAALDIALPDAEHVTAEAGTGIPLHASDRLLMLATAVTSSLAPGRDHLVRRLCSGKIAAGAHRPYAIIAPGAGSVISQWPAERLALIARRLIEASELDVVLTGGPSEIASASEIAASLPADRVRNVCGQLALAELPDLIAGSRLYVGNDTGTTHLAGALGVPTIAIVSGVPNIEVWYPKGRNVRVIAGRIACSPCYLVRPEQCPYGVPCMDDITVEIVWSACEAALNERDLLDHAATATQR